MTMLPYSSIGSGGSGSISIGGFVSGGTSGSVLFIGAGGILSQNNSKLFWDNSSNFLGIGTNAPIRTLHISGGNILLENDKRLEIKDSAGNVKTLVRWDTADNMLVGRGGSTNMEFSANTSYKFNDNGILNVIGQINTNNTGFWGKDNQFVWTATTVRLGKPLAAGTATAGTAPLKLTSGTILTAPEAGAIEFNTDTFFATITTGTVRTAFILDDGVRLTAYRVPYVSGNGRLTDSADLYVDGSGTLTATYFQTTLITSPTGGEVTYSSNADNVILEAFRLNNVGIGNGTGTALTFFNNTFEAARVYGLRTGSSDFALGFGVGSSATERYRIDSFGRFIVGSVTNNRAVQNPVLYGVTTDAATAVELTTNGSAGSGSSNRLSVNNNSAMSVVVNICVKQSGSANAKQMLRQFLISNNGGTTAIQGTVTTLGTDVGSVALATVTTTITANDTDDCIKIEVNGVAATNLRYTAFVVSTETIYS